MRTPLLDNLISLLPDKPGVYLMKDEQDKIIYIGKAKSLKKRVSQYFLRPQSGKVQAMVSHVHHFDTILVHSDKEAFILEMNLIQTHYPRYNIMLMDDSHYPYIALKKGNDPFLKIARSSKDPKYYYFGPFPSASSAYQTIDLLNKIYPTRKCKTLQKKPCLYYSLGQCLAPCINELSKEQTEGIYEDIKRFLHGDIAEAEKQLKQKMEAAADALEFERAGEYKKALDSLRYTVDKQSVELTGDKVARDVFAFAEREGYRSLSILTYRRGLLLGKNVHVVPSFGEVSEQVESLIEQYYSSHELPKEVVIRLPLDLESIFDGLKVVYPKEGRLLEMVHLAELNASQGLDAHFLSAKLEDDQLALLEELSALLHTPLPLRIELFDNSHLQGSSPVSAMVCYINGMPCKKMYRKYHLLEEDAGDDYHSMVEVVTRRYRRLKEEGQSFPDLILTDGGLPQVHATLEGLSAVDVSIPVFGLFKNDKHQTEGLIDKDGQVYPLDSHSPLFFLLMRMQDEVHRFAISFHKQMRSSSMLKGILDDIPGVGAKRKEALERAYPSLDSLKKASVEELSQILPSQAAEQLHARLHPQGK